MCDLKMKLDSIYMKLLAALASVFIALFFASTLFAANLKLVWDAPGSTHPAVAGYYIHYAAEGNYLGFVDAGKATTYKFQDLELGVTYFFAVSAYSARGVESVYSNVLTTTATDTAPADSDADGVPDDGVGNAGSHPCTANNIYGCDDNCKHTYNPQQADTDGDGAGDVCDNCVQVYNPDQKDSNSTDDDNKALDGMQHYGNACDSDFDNDGIGTLTDYALIQQNYRLSVPPAPGYMDLDGDGLITLTDVSAVKKYYRFAPGPGLDN